MLIRSISGIRGIVDSHLTEDVILSHMRGAHQIFNAGAIIVGRDSRPSGAMITNIVIDDELLNEAFSVSNSKTKKDLIHEALREFIRLKNRRPLTDLAGSIKFYKNYDHKQLRKLRG